MSSDHDKPSNKHNIGSSEEPGRTEGKRQRLDEKDTREGEPPAEASADASPAGSRPSVGARYSSGSVAAKCQTSTLFVGGLHTRVADVHLQKLFQPYGTVARIFQVKHKEGSLAGQPKGYAFVEYSTVDSAKLAIERIDGKVLLGRTLHVRPAHTKTETAGDNSSAPGESKPSDARSIRKEKSEVESKIEAVKRAIEEKRKKGLSSRR